MHKSYEIENLPLVIKHKTSILNRHPIHRIKIQIEGPLTSEALKFLSSRMSHYACWPPNVPSQSMTFSGQ